MIYKFSLLLFRAVDTLVILRSVTYLFLWLVEVFDDVVHSLPDGLLNLG